MSSWPKSRTSPLPRRITPGGVAVAAFRFANANCIRNLYEVEIVGIDTRAFAGCVDESRNVSGPPGMNFAYTGAGSFEVQITLSLSPLLANQPITVRIHNLNAFSRTGASTQGVLGAPTNRVAVDLDSLRPLTRSSKTSVLPVRLTSQPSGNKNVTLTMGSSVPADVRVFPSKLVFTPTGNGSWDTTQPLTVSLTDAAKSRLGNIDVTLNVHDASEQRGQLPKPRSGHAGGSDRHTEHGTDVCRRSAQSQHKREQWYRSIHRSDHCRGCGHGRRR